MKKRVRVRDVPPESRLLWYAHLDGFDPRDPKDPSEQVGYLAPPETIPELRAHTRRMVLLWQSSKLDKEHVLRTNKTF